MNGHGDTCCSTQTHNPVSTPTGSLLMLLNAVRLLRRNDKYQIYSFWFDPNLLSTTFDVTVRRVVMYYLLLELNHDNGHNGESSNLLLTTGAKSLQWQGLINPLARRPGLVISTFGLAEIISCMPDGLVKIYIGY